MKAKITLLLFFISFYAFSQAPAWVWTDHAGGNNYDDATSVTTDLTGNVYVTGTFFNDTIVFGNDTLRTNGLTDLFLIKYNSSGNRLWVKHFGGTSDEFISGVTTDLWGNVYITGTFSSPSLAFGSAVLLNPVTGFPDIFIVKFDSNGNTLWAKKEGQPDYDHASSVVTDPVNGQPYLAGAFYGNNILVGTTTLTNNGLYDVMLIKYDTAGNVLWAKSSGGSLNDLGNAVSVDKACNVYVAGGFASSSISFSSTVLTNAGAGFPDIFVAKYDSAGNFSWAKNEGGGDNDHAVTVMNDTSCNVFVGGHYHSVSFPFASGTLTNAGMGDLFLLKYDSAGNALWGKSEGGMDMDFGYSVTIDPAGNSYFAGMFMSMSMNVGSTMLMNASMDEDMLLIKYDSSGNVTWALSAGGTGREYINCVTINAAGNLYAVGSFGSATMMLGTTTFINSDASGNTSDMFAGKLDVVTATTEINDPQALFVYPNPSTGKFNLQINNYQIEIYNSLGENIYSSWATNQTEVDLSTQPNGIYFIKLQSEKESITQKIIIRK